MRRLFGMLAIVGALCFGAAGQAREPIFDMHLHASAADEQGPSPLGICSPIDPKPDWDGRGSWGEAMVAFFKHPPCRHPIWSPMTDAQVQARSLAAMRRLNVIGVVNDEPACAEHWRAAAPDRLYVGYSPGDAELADPALLERRLVALKAQGRVTAIGEVGARYRGIDPGDPRLDGLWTVAEKLDLPVSLHVGPGPPGTPYLGTGYRARLSGPLALEEVLVRHPRLRLNVMHAGYPMLDATLPLFYAHPQVYVDVSVIDWTQPRAAFYRYLRALVEAGFGRRILFGSDQMIWPEAIERAVATIRAAPFLTRAQQRDILYDNAARFLRLDAATIARHHAM